MINDVEWLTNRRMITSQILREPHSSQTMHQYAEAITRFEPPTFRSVICLFSLRATEPFYPVLRHNRFIEDCLSKSAFFSLTRLERSPLGGTLTGHFLISPYLAWGCKIVPPVRGQMARYALVLSAFQLPPSLSLFGGAP